MLSLRNKRESFTLLNTPIVFCILIIITFLSFGYATSKDVKITVWAGGTNEADYYRMEAIKMAADIVTREMAIQGDAIKFYEDISDEKKYITTVGFKSYAHYFYSRIDELDSSDQLYTELKKLVRKEIGPIATPDLLQFSPQLPKTRSGKIMRRILRKIAANEYQDLGDTSTLADPSVVNDLIDNRQNK